MKLTKEECLEVYELVTEELCDNDCNFCIFDSKLCKSAKVKKVMQQLINEYFDNNLTATCQNMVSQVDNLNRTLDEVREQGSSYMNEAQKYRNLYQEVLEENEYKHIENKALADDNAMLRNEIEKLKFEIKKLERNNA